ncbi:MAG: hypothetical protein HYZ75_13220 [Elusimicrobia bacterium]|nr:hypothetical protein [Elusimicrobiota bacterium]
MSLPEPLKEAGLPPRLVAHLEACELAGLDGWVLSKGRAEPERTAEALRALFDGAAMTTGLAPDELLLRTGLGVDDLRGYRADGALAEIRTICFLDALGFSKIVPLGPDDTRQRADLTAEREGERWAIDARCASRSLLPEGTFRRGRDGNPLPFPTLYDYLIHCRDEKAGQLARTSADEGCTRSAVAVAFEGDMPGELMRSETLRAWLAGGGDKSFAFGLMPGLFVPSSSEDALVPAP